MLAPKTLITAMLTTFVGWLGSPSTAWAGPSDNSSSRPWSLQLGLGPSANFRGGLLGKFTPDFQYHFKGGDVGPALGGQAHMHFAERTFGMNLGPSFLWDFRVYEGGFKLYVAPIVSLGYGFSAFARRRPDRDFVGPRASHFFFTTFGAQLKGMWNDRVGFYVRPADISVWAGPDFVTGFYTFHGGVSFSF